MSGLSWLADTLSIPFPEGLQHTTTRIVLAALVGLVIPLVAGSAFIKMLTALKVGQPIRDEKGFLLAELHKQKKNTPTMGGLLIVCSVCISAFLFADWSTFFTPVVICALVYFGCIGAFDDWAKLRSKSSKGISGRLRLVLQSVFAIGVIVLLSRPEALKALGYKVPVLLEKGVSVPWDRWIGTIQFSFPTQPLFVAGGLSWLFIWFVQWLTMVGGANAVNLTDGIDGLAAGCTAWVVLALSIVALYSNHQILAADHDLIYIQSCGEIAICLAALGGASLGFLWFNTYPAQVFMGDTGSLAIGGMLGTSAVLLHREWFFGFVGAIFVAETLSVILQVLFFKRSGKRIFRCSPLHHHFEYGGLHEAKVVVRFWIVGALLAAFGIISIIV